MRNAQAAPLRLFQCFAYDLSEFSRPVSNPDCCLATHCEAGVVEAGLINGVGQFIRQFIRLEDQIEDIRVKLLRFDYKFARGQRMTLEMNQEGGLKPMQELMKHKGANAQFYNITQARIYIKFPGKGRRGSVTIQITAPDKCNLNDSPLHLKAKEYLRFWNLENAAKEMQAV